MKIFNGQIKHDNEDLICKMSKYVENNNTALMLLDNLGSPYATVTVNLDKLPENEAVIRSDYYEDLLKGGLISKKISDIRYGYKVGYLCDINLDKFIEEESQCEW